MTLKRGRIIKELSEEDLTFRLRNVDSVLERDLQLKSEVKKLTNDYLYDREVCESIGINYNRPTVLDELRVKLYAYSIIISSR